MNLKRTTNAGKNTRLRLTVFLILAALLVVLSVLAPLLAPNDPNATSSAAVPISRTGSTVIFLSGE